MLERKIGNKGTLRIYKDVQMQETKDDFMSVGQDIIMTFEPDPDLGEDGDSVSFVQYVRDDFYYIMGGKNIYTSKKFNPLLQATEFSEIDQVANEENNDVRYPEWRLVERDPLCTEVEKIGKLLAMSKEQIENQGFRMPEEYFGMSEEGKIEYLRQRLYDESDPLPQVVFSTVKKDGEWGITRLSDEPRSRYPVACEGTGGGYQFETVVVYSEASKPTTLYPLCRVCWGWECSNRALVKKDTTVDEESCSAELKAALNKWKIHTGTDFVISE